MHSTASSKSLWEILPRHNDHGSCVHRGQPVPMGCREFTLLKSSPHLKAGDSCL